MTHPAIHFVTVLLAFFAIMNPIANAPLFLALTEEFDSGTKRMVALRSVGIAFIIISAFAISGREIFSAFGITLPAFRIAGGLMIGLIGYHMLQGQNSSLHTPTEEDNEKSRDAALDIAITPLAIPILAGPGTIATAMNFAAQSSFPQILRVLGAFALMCALTFIAFLGSRWLSQALGQNAIKVVSRLMGLILAVIGVQMLIAGIHGAGLT
ncbi:MAG: MarC family protein [Gammaproteobacteria bacterium]|jgi:multiple antibiotic resistance protein